MAAPQVASGPIGVAVHLVAPEPPPVAVIDDDQDSAIVAVAVVALAHEVRLVLARLIVVVAVAAPGHRLDDAPRLIAALPDPRTLAALVVEGVVRRRVTQATVH